MGLNDVTFVKGQGGLGRPLPGQDFISGLLYYCADNKLPSGFTTSNRIKQLFQPSDAIAAGIFNDFRDEVAALATYLVTNAGGAGTRGSGTVTVSAIGATNDTAQLFVNGVAICASVIQTGSETTAALMAAKINTAINAATSTNGGFTSTVSGAVITVLAPLSSGSNYNGLLVTYTVNTGSTGAATIVAFTDGVFPSSGDAVAIIVTEYDGTVVTLGTYIKPVTDTTVGAVATGIAAAINANSATTGYTATINTATVTIKARPGLGKSLNTGSPLVVTISSGSTIAGTVTGFTGGVGSLMAVWYYHISEFFRMQPKGQLYVGFFTTPLGTPTYSEIITLQTFAQGAIRQIGIYKDFAALNASVDTTAIQTQCAALDAVKMGISVMLGADISGTTDISALPTLATLSNNKVSVIIGQDGAGLGNQLFYAYGKSITTVGAILGAVALAAVNENIAWIAKFNFSNGFELDTITFANGEAMPSVTSTLLGALNDLRYIFMRQFAAGSTASGTYANDSHTAIAVTSDYAYIENNRTIDKAIRGVYGNLLPDLNAPIVLNANGTLTNADVSIYEDNADATLLQMQKDGEISAPGVTIDPTQNVASTSKVYITIQLVPVGVARNIIVNIGFTQSLS